MSTRSTIKIEGVNYAKVYKHWDGYPERMIPFLKEFNKSFKEARGDDPEYKFAQLLRWTMNEKYGLDNSKFTGYGVIPFNSNYGEEYEYILMKDGTVKVKEVEFT